MLSIIITPRLRRQQPSRRPAVAHSAAAVATTAVAQSAAPVAQSAAAVAATALAQSAGASSRSLSEPAPMFQRLCPDARAIVNDDLVNPLAPQHALNLSSTCTEQYKLLGEGARQQLKEAHKRAGELCDHMGVGSVVELREATSVTWLIGKEPGSCGYLVEFGSLGPVLPKLRAFALTMQAGASTTISCRSSYGPLEELTVGLLQQVDPHDDQGWGGRECTLCALTDLTLTGVHVAERGALALAQALDLGALPRLKQLNLGDTDIGDAALEYLAPALRRRPALESLRLGDNSELSDDGIVALIEPQPADEDVPPPPTGMLRRLRLLDLSHTDVTVEGCVFLQRALAKGLLPALDTLNLLGVDGWPIGLAGPVAGAGDVVPPSGPPARAA